MSKSPTGERRFDRLPDVLTVKEAADALGVSVGLMRAAIARNQIPSIRMGRRILIARRALVFFVLGSDESR